MKIIILFFLLLFSLTSFSLSGDDTDYDPNAPVNDGIYILALIGSVWFSYKLIKYEKDKKGST